MIHLLLAVIYLAFISLGLPDSLLGSAWPLMYEEMGVSVSCAGIVSMIISCGTVVSSLLSDRIARKISTGWITAICVALTAGSLLGFSISTRFWMLCLFAIPYGFGAGSIDAALNNYVAVHYASRHMSWLHCMWGVGATTGPYIMSFCLGAGMNWPSGYRAVGTIQLVLAVVMFLSLPLWSKTTSANDNRKSAGISLGKTLQIPGAKAILVAFFSYCAIEAVIFLWSASYMVLHHGLTEETAASYVALFFLGMTVGRAINGFLTMRWSDSVLIRSGCVILFIGILLLMLPDIPFMIPVALTLIGLGCAPIYPCVIHSTPVIFGEDNSQAMIGMQMASAYLGTLLMPPVFGILANYIHIGLFPLFLLLLASMTTGFYLLLLRRTP